MGLWMQADRETNLDHMNFEAETFQRWQEVFPDVGQKDASWKQDHAPEVGDMEVTDSTDDVSSQDPSPKRRQARGGAPMEIKIGHWIVCKSLQERSKKKKKQGFPITIKNPKKKEEIPPAQDKERVLEDLKI